MKNEYKDAALSWSTLTDAEGTIEAGDTQQERLQECTERLGLGEFHVTTREVIPCVCIDGRPGGHVAPNAAGGSETLFVADDLTTRRFMAPDGSTLGGYAATLKTLRKRGYPIGGHSDDHAHGGLSGCGANDKLPLIYDFIRRNGDVVRRTAEAFGVAVNTDTHECIVRNAAMRTTFSPGAELLHALQATGGNESVDSLQGSHNEVVAAVNTKAGTTLDRAALAQAFGGRYEAFNIDLWSFDAAAQAISLSEDEAQSKKIAMVYYNFATAYVLCGKHMRIVVV